MDNLVQLCRHHHRLLHEGGFSVEGRPSGQLVFRRPDGRAIRAVPRSPRRGDPGCLVETNRRRGRRMTPTTCAPRWEGERLDLGLAVDAVLACAPLQAAPVPPAESPEDAAAPAAAAA
jgi:hypothetical protein